MGELFGIFIFIYNMSLLYDIIQEYKETDRLITKDKTAIHRFMRDKQVSPTLKSRINSYLEEFWYQEGARDFGLETKVIELLGPELRQQLLHEAYGPFLRHAPLFERFSSEFVRELTQHVGELRLSKGESVIRDRQAKEAAAQDDEAGATW